MATRCERSTTSTTAADATENVTADNIGEISICDQKGEDGLISLKCFDPQYTFFRIFEKDALLILQRLEFKIVRYREKLRAIDQAIKVKGLESPLPSKHKLAKRKKKVEKKHKKAMLAFYDFVIKAWTVSGLSRPLERSLEDLKVWTDSKFPEASVVFDGVDRDDFRTIGKKKTTKLDDVVLSLPRTKIGSVLFSPFRVAEECNGIVQYRLDSIVFTGRIVTFLLPLLFLIFPLWFLSSGTVGRNIGVLIAVVLTLLFTLMAQLMAPARLEVQSVLVLAYAAIIGNYLFNNM